MSTDNPVEESDASIESRLSAVFASEPVVPEVAPEVQEQESAEVEDNEAQEPVEVEDSGEYIDFEADDGTTIKLPAAAKDAVLRQADYTRKTQAVAELQKQAQDRLQYAEAREQISSAVLEDVTQLRSLESQLKQYQEADWRQLFAADPGQALQFQQTMSNLKEQVAQKKSDIQGKAQHIQRATAEHQQVQWQHAEKAARQMLGEVTAAENAAMLQTIKGLGIDQAEFKARFADPRIIALTHKAAKWDALQAGKPAAVKAANTAPPVVKPGASKGPSQAADKRYMDTRQSLKKSGSVEDAAKLFLLRGR
jgi:hypothetical protein